MKTPKHHWTDEELHYLTQNYPIYGSKYVQNKYPFLSLRQIQSKAKQLELKYNWTPREIVILRMNYGTMSINQLKTLLPKRSVSSIRHKANSCGICTAQGKKKFHSKYHRWTQEEIDSVTQHYSEKGSRYIAQLFPHISRIAIELKARSLGLHARTTNWTNEEKDIVRNHFREGYRKVMELLPNKTKSAIITMGSRLKCTNYRKRSYKYRPSLAQIEKKKMKIRQQNYEKYSGLMVGT